MQIEYVVMTEGCLIAICDTVQKALHEVRQLIEQGLSAYAFPRGKRNG